MSKRIILIILDGFGVGELPDAGLYNDIGANTLKSVLSLDGTPHLKNLYSLGLMKIAGLNGKLTETIIGNYAKAKTVSSAKDTTIGHWEIAGIVTKNVFPVFPKGFPAELIDKFEDKIGVKVIGNVPASGTEIINKLGDEHVKTKCPIVYTSADSVFQVACHEDVYSVGKLYEICELARGMLVGKYNVGRVIARPFRGGRGDYCRTENRKDFSVPPPDGTLLDKITQYGGKVVAIGKIEDIFCFRGITDSIHTKNNTDGMEATLKEVKKAPHTNTLIFTNLVDFDMLWGHRRNPDKYLKELEKFDEYLPSLISVLEPEDILIVTSDHGCDPSFLRHTDHTREYVPVMVFGKGLSSGINLGELDCLSDISQTIAEYFGLFEMENGASFYKKMLAENHEK